MPGEVDWFQHGSTWAEGHLWPSWEAFLPGAKSVAPWCLHSWGKTVRQESCEPIFVEKGWRWLKSRWSREMSWEIVQLTNKFKIPWLASVSQTATWCGFIGFWGFKQFQATNRLTNWQNQKHGHFAVFFTLRVQWKSHENRCKDMMSVDYTKVTPGCDSESQAPEMALSAFYDSFALDCFALGVVSRLGGIGKFGVGHFLRICQL